jgi:hypothetical protein
VVAAVDAALSAELRPGTIIQLVDPLRQTQNDVLRQCPPSGPILRVPRFVVFASGWLSEVLLRLIKRNSPLSVYRLRSALPRLDFQSSCARELLGWQPRGGVAGDAQQERHDCARQA